MKTGRGSITLVQIFVLKKIRKKIFTHYETFDFNTRKMVCGNHLSVRRINFQIHLNYLSKKRLLYVRLKKKKCGIGWNKPKRATRGEFKTVNSQPTYFWIAPFLNDKSMYSKNVQIKNKIYCKLFLLSSFPVLLLNLIYNFV